MYENKNIGIVVLAFNEEMYIKPVISEIPSYIDKICVVDDGSVDKTANIVKAINDPRIQLIQHGFNKGPGAALLNGYRAVIQDGMDIIVKVDGDNQMSLEQIIRLIKPISEGIADYTKGDRLSNSDHRKGMPFIRLCGNLILTLMTRIASGNWNLSDSQNGFTAISNKALNIIGLNLYSDYGYLNDLLVKLNASNLRVLDVEIPARYAKETSSIRMNKYIPRLLWLLGKNYFWRIKLKVFPKR